MSYQQKEEKIMGGRVSLPYRVFARKYRPQTFADLLGQDALIRTLSGAFAKSRVAQAYILTGVRGVGKTTTARLLARAFNYVVEGVFCPGLSMPTLGEHCLEILESRHPDVLEMDAASRTGVDDIRDVIDQARYRPVSAPYKVFIIDEVHMLSKQAFNALLKTLEEPPDHVKFIFATTEIRKVPITVLSRCQRFDLKRISASLLLDHFKSICDREGIAVEQDALRLIVRASEGSARDGLSLLERAVAYGGDEVKTQDVAHILGLSDREKIFDLFEQIMSASVPEACLLLEELLRDGASSESLILDLSRLIHAVTRFKVLPALPFDETFSPTEEKRARELAQRLSMAALTRAWQMTLKGIKEISESLDPDRTLEMFLVRFGYAAALPTPFEILKTSPDSAYTQTIAAVPHVLLAEKKPSSQEKKETEEGVCFTKFSDILAYASEKRDLAFRLLLEEKVRPIQLDSDHLEIALEPSAPKNLIAELSKKLQNWTGRVWRISVLESGGELPYAQQEKIRREKRKEEVREDLVVKEILSAFPGAELVEVLSHDGEEGIVVPSEEDGIFEGEE